MVLRFADNRREVFARFDAGINFQTMPYCLVVLHLDSPSSNAALNLQTMSYRLIVLILHKTSLDAALDLQASHRPMVLPINPPIFMIGLVFIVVPS